MQDRRPRRRTVLAMGLAAVGAGSLAACRWKRAAGGWRSFTDDEARTVEAICEQLIPADRDPGARDAGVVNYIDIQLAKRLRKHRPVYRAGLVAINAASRAKFGKSLAETTPDRQAEILKDLEDSGSEFFDLILTHTRQGFYGDPRHGGNRNMASWKMLRLPFPPVRGREHYGSQAGSQQG
jgi:gluconate 2-dehydrogenase gamma chain